VHLSMGFRHADLTLKQRDVVRLELQKVRRAEARAVRARDEAMQECDEMTG